ncbi:MAG: hypothetical protein DRI61_01980, partial [Chloroflexi bacterium]
IIALHFTLVYKIARRGGSYFFDGSFAAVEEITSLNKYPCFGGIPLMPKRHRSYWRTQQGWGQAWARAKSPGLSSESPLEAGCLGRWKRPFSAQPGALSSQPFCRRLCQKEHRSAPG